jgi:hypothetical protein
MKTIMMMMTVATITTHQASCYTNHNHTANDETETTPQAETPGVVTETTGVAETQEWSQRSQEWSQRTQE